jgi:hypothetical protein
MALNGTNLYAGGAFTTIGGQSRNYIARVSTTGGAVDPTWNPSADYDVLALAVNGLCVYAGGSFTNIGGLHRDCLAKLSSTGTGAADATWDADPDNWVVGMAMGSTGLYVAGKFTQIGGQPRAGIASLTFAPLTLGPAQCSNGQFQFILAGERGQSFEIQASTNLVNWATNWATICTLTNSAGTTPFTDPATNLPRRFYRAHQLP